MEILLPFCTGINKAIAPFLSSYIKSPAKTSYLQHCVNGTRMDTSSWECFPKLGWKIEAWMLLKAMTGIYIFFCCCEICWLSATIIVSSSWLVGLLGSSLYTYVVLHISSPSFYAVLCIFIKRVHTFLNLMSYSWKTWFRFFRNSNFKMCPLWHLQFLNHIL